MINRRIKMIEKIKKGFTLAEVLITLAIIGIVAALTIPTLVTNYKKKIVTTRLLKFYSAMKQAGIYANAQGAFGSMPQTDDATGDDILEWYESNMAMYLRVQSTEKIKDGILGRLADGSGFVLIYGGHTVFCPEYKACEEGIEKTGNNSGMDLFTMYLDGKNTFAFFLGGDRGFSTYDICWDGTRDGAVSSTNPPCEWPDRAEYGCKDKHKLCAKLIEIDGWKIADDYPVKF